MKRILIAYSTTDGHTVKICTHLQSLLETAGHTVSMAPMADIGREELEQADTIVIGASIRYGKHQPQVYAFISEHQALLDARGNAFFTVNVVARKPEKNTPETNPYLLKFLKQISWKPKLLGVFAGRINYSMYGFVDRTMIRFIMWITKGPTAADTDVEFTDWTRVDAFARQVGEM